MSKIFYDHLIVFENLEGIIKKTARSSEEKEEFWKLVDDIVHKRILTLILDNLDKNSHEEFLEEYHLRPHDPELITYLSSKSKKDVNKLIKNELETLENELLRELNLK